MNRNLNRIASIERDQNEGHTGLSYTLKGNKIGVNLVISFFYSCKNQQKKRKN